MDFLLTAVTFVQLKCAPWQFLRTKRLKARRDLELQPTFINDLNPLKNRQPNQT